jgi:hypothetical protein
MAATPCRWGRGRFLHALSEHPSSKTPDIRVQIGLEWHDVEIKAVHPSPIDDAAEELHRRLSAGDMLVPGLNLTLVGNNDFASRAGTALDSIMREADAIVRAFADAASRVRTAAVPGEYEAPPYGLIRAVPGPRFGSVTPALMPELSQERRVVKAMRLVRRAAEQLTTRRGIAITGVWHAANLLDLAEAVRSEARKQPNAFRCCHMVVLIDSVTDESTGRRSIPIALPVQVHERRALTKAQLRFASAAAGDGGNQARFVRAAKPGEPGVTLRTTRRPVTSVSLGSAAMPIGGGTMTFHFDGRPPEVSPLEDDYPGGETS